MGPLSPRKAPNHLSRHEEGQFSTRPVAATTCHVVAGMPVHADKSSTRVAAHRVERANALLLKYSRLRQRARIHPHVAVAASPGIVHGSAWYLGSQ